MFRLSVSLSLGMNCLPFLPMVFRDSVVAPSLFAASDERTRRTRGSQWTRDMCLWGATKLGEAKIPSHRKIVVGASPKIMERNNFEVLVCNSRNRKIKSPCTLGPHSRLLATAAVPIAPRRRRSSPTALQGTCFFVPLRTVADHCRTLVLIILQRAEVPTTFSSPDFDTCCSAHSDGTLRTAAYSNRHNSEREVHL